MRLATLLGNGLEFSVSGELIAESQLRDVDVLDLNVTATVRSWETLYDRGGHGAEHGGGGTSRDEGHDVGRIGHSSWCPGHGPWAS